jgi:hypothetical protein
MDDKQAVFDEFKSNINMTPSALKKYLDTDNSNSVGIKKGTSSDKKSSPEGGESTGHESGRKILAILKKNKTDFTEGDYTHMKKVSGYIKRHLAQKPTKEDVEDSRWRYSLMNWGHDPVKS